MQDTREGAEIDELTYLMQDQALSFQRARELMDGLTALSHLESQILRDDVADSAKRRS